jgi:hypothetical protein
MRTIELNVYTFEELTEAIQKIAIEANADINVSGDWWESVCEDAKNIGLDIKNFDLDRNGINGTLLFTGHRVARLIIDNHGKDCNTFFLACNFENGEYEYEGRFLLDLLDAYRIMLKNEYEYLTSEAAITETLRINEYEFTADGKRYF